MKFTCLFTYQLYNLSDFLSPGKWIHFKPYIWCPYPRSSSKFINSYDRVHKIILIYYDSLYNTLETHFTIVLRIFKWIICISNSSIWYLNNIKSIRVQSTNNIQICIFSKIKTAVNILDIKMRFTVENIICKGFILFYSQNKNSILYSI